MTWFCLVLFMGERLRWEILGHVVFNANNLDEDSFHAHWRLVSGIIMNQIPKSSRFVVFPSCIVTLACQCHFVHIFCCEFCPCTKCRTSSAETAFKHVTWCTHCISSVFHKSPGFYYTFGFHKSSSGVQRLVDPLFNRLANSLIHTILRTHSSFRFFAINRGHFWFFPGTLCLL